MYTINARFGFQSFVTYRDLDISARITEDGLTISGHGDSAVRLVPVKTNDTEGWLEAIEVAVAAGHLSEPAASCLSMLVEEPWLEGGAK